MLVSSLSGWSCSVRVSYCTYAGFSAWLMCLAFQLYKNMLFAWSAIHARGVLLFPHLSPIHWLWYLQYTSTDSVRMMVPGCCCPQGCNGYLHALLEAHIYFCLAPPTLRFFFPCLSIDDKSNRLLHQFVGIQLYCLHCSFRARKVSWILHCNWLPKWAICHHIACSELPAVFHKNRM